MPVPTEVEQEFDQWLDAYGEAWQDELQSELGGATTEGAKYERCVADVTAKGDTDNPHAVCKAALGECSEEDCGCPGCKAKQSKTLLEELTVLNVPDERQEEGWSCGAACVTAVCRFFGVTPDTEGDAIRQLGTSPRDGTDPERVIAVLENAGLETVALSGMGFAEVEHFLSRGMPVIVCCQSWGEPDEVKSLESGHYVVICGATPTHVQIMDPARFDPSEAGPEYGGVSLGGQKVSVPRQRFWAGWQDVDTQGNVYNRYGIAVQPRVE